MADKRRLLCLSSGSDGIGMILARGAERAYGKKFANDAERVAHLFDLYAVVVKAK